MKSNLIRVSTVGMTKADWLAFRHSGIGGSEMGSVMGLNPYKASIELFYEKLRAPKDTEANEAMFFGNILEDVVADVWQYFESDPASMIKNYEEKRIIRKCRRVNAYIRNPKFPFLFISLDRLITKEGSDEEKILEIKTISGYATKQWESGMPPSHLIQLQDYLLVTELRGGEIAMLKDGRYLEVIPFEANPVIMESVLRQGEIFWDRVLKARRIIASFGFEFLPDDNLEILQAVSHLEPPPDNSESYKEYLQTRYKTEAITRPGRTEDLRKAIEILDHQETIKQIDLNINLLSNQIKVYMGEAEVLDFGSGGKISWRENKKGTRVFLLSGVKPEAFRPAVKLDPIIPGLEAEILKEESID